MSQLPERIQTNLKAVISQCDDRIKEFQVDDGVNVPNSVHRLFQMLINLQRVKKLILQTCLKQNIKLLPILRERYANDVVDCMAYHQELIKKSVISEQIYIHYCKISSAETNALNNVISHALDRDIEKVKIIEIDINSIIIQNEDEDEDEDEEEEQAPEPIYDVNPNAIDVEICAFFTNIQS